MAVPKRKMSKARRDSRRANWKLTAPGLVEMPAMSRNENAAPCLPRMWLLQW